MINISIMNHELLDDHYVGHHADDLDDPVESRVPCLPWSSNCLQLLFNKVGLDNIATPFPLRCKITTFGRIDHHYHHDLRLQVDNILPDLPNIQFAVPILLSLRFCVLYTHTKYQISHVAFKVIPYLSICKIHRRSKNNVHWNQSIWKFPCFQAKQKSHPPGPVFSWGDTAGSNSLLSSS